MPSSQVSGHAGSASTIVLSTWRSLNQYTLDHRWIYALTQSKRAFARFSDYIHKHPILFALQALGFTACVMACILLPVLGAIGFSAAGPVAGSAAAAWQASLGIVQAGTLFAWCQSAAMGGGAVSAIIATGVLGGATAVTPGAIHMASQRMSDLGTQVKWKLQAMWPWQ